MYKLKLLLKNLLPAPLFSLYHLFLAHLGALVYGFPSRKLTVIGVTGTDGKSSTIEYINAIFEAAGHTTSLSNSIRVKIASHTESSTGRSMPGRFFIQRFMRRALDTKCTVAIVEMTSEGVKQHRHRAIELDCLVLTNLTPEHIESHGSFEAYANAKFEIGSALARSRKRPRVMVANADDAQSSRYLALSVEKVVGISLAGHAPWRADERGGSFTFKGQLVHVAIPGEFYVRNALAAAEVAGALGIGTQAIAEGIAAITAIPGRMQRVECGQDFGVVVDYALTPDALEKLYKTYGSQKKVCIFGCTGGGRDKWKRPVLGKLAEQYCDSVIITNDVAYGEDAKNIAEDVARDMQKKPEIILDRRIAIRRGIEIAASSSERHNTVVLITGMGIDTEITDANGVEVPWSDVEVAREELRGAQAARPL